MDLRRPVVWLVPLAVAVIQVLGSTGMRHRVPDPHLVPLTWWGYLLLIAGPVVLLARIRYPYSVLLAVLAITVVYQLAGFGPGPVFLSLVVAFLQAATVGPRWWTYPLPMLGWVVLAWLWWVRGVPGPGLDALGGLGAWLLVLLAVAEGLRQRHSVVVARRQRREAMALQARSEQQRQATSARLAIARELHDVLAHSLSMINVQSSVALELLEEQPQRAGPALAAIKEASRQAISDVHSLVAALRTEAGEPTAPTPGTADLAALLAPARATGLTVTTAVHGDVRALPAVIDVAAARIVQESLTNVVRHSTATTAAVQLTYVSGELTVGIDNDGHPLNDGPSAGGSGITGMRERARALGGTFTARRVPGGGFSVRATFPVDESPLDESGDEP